MKLQKGDTVFITAASSPPEPVGKTLPPEDLKTTVEKLGYRAVLGETLFSRTESGFAAAPPEVKARDLMTAFTDPEIDAVWCAIGGSTALQVLPLLDYEEIARHPKPFIGISDSTGVLLPVAQRCGFPTFYGPTVRGFWEEPSHYALQSLQNAVNAQGRFVFRNPKGTDILSLHPGECRGRLIGGNLSLVTALVGSEYLGDTEGTILFLEDVGEPIYRLERMLTQLKYAGILDRTAGLVIGDFKNCKNRYNPDYGYMELFREFFRDYDRPVVYNVVCGHCTPTGTLPLGAECTLTAGEEPSLIFRY